MSSENAFGDEPIHVEPCKCGYQWREGALPEEICGHANGEYVVICPLCKADGGFKARPKWAVEAWNAERRGQEVETILRGIAKDILHSDEFKQKLAELGPEKIRENIERGLARLDQRAVESARRMVTK